MLFPVHNPVIIHFLRFASAASLALLLANVPTPTNVTDPAILALWGVVVTSIAGITLQVLRSNADARRDERRHRFEMEDREKAVQARNEIFQALEENARLVAEGTARAEAAYGAANDINTKIAKLAATALTPHLSHKADQAAAILKDLNDQTERSRG